MSQLSLERTFSSHASFWPPFFTSGPVTSSKNETHKQPWAKKDVDKWLFNFWQVNLQKQNEKMRKWKWAYESINFVMWSLMWSSLHLLSHGRRKEPVGMCISLFSCCFSFLKWRVHQLHFKSKFKAFHLHSASVKGFAREKGTTKIEKGRKGPKRKNFVSLNLNPSLTLFASCFIEFGSKFKCKICTKTRKEQEMMTLECVCLCVSS